MLIYLYLLLLAITLLFFFIGLFADSPILSITGAGFLFLMGYVLMGVNTGIGDPPGIEFPTGKTATTTGNDTTTTTTYTTYSHRTIGFFMEFIAFAAIFLTLLDMWRARRT